MKPSTVHSYIPIHAWVLSLCFGLAQIATANACAPQPAEGLATCCAQDSELDLQSSPRESAHAHHVHRDDAPISIMGSHAHPANEWMLSYRFMRMDMDGMRDGSDRISSVEVFGNGYSVTPEDMTMDMHMLGLMYAPTDQLTLMLMSNYVQSEMKHSIVSQMAANMINAGATSFTTRSEGIGDTSFSAIYDLYQKDSRHVLIGLGLSLPTGSIDETDKLPGMGGPADRMLPAAMQLGSGTFDLLPSLTFLHDLESWAYGVQAKGTLRLEEENNRGYRRGHSFDLQAWANYRLPAGFAANIGLHYAYTGQLHGTQKDVSLMGPNGKSVPAAFGENYGGERLDAILGIGWQGERGLFKGQRFALDLRLPVSQDLNGLQLETDSILTLGWWMSF